MNISTRMEDIIELGKTTGLYLDHLNEQLDAVDGDNKDVSLNATALVKTLEVLTQTVLRQALEMNLMTEKVNKLTEIHQSHFDI